MELEADASPLLQRLRGVAPRLERLWCGPELAANESEVGLEAGKPVKEPAGCFRSGCLGIEGDASEDAGWASAPGFVEAAGGWEGLRRVEGARRRRPREAFGGGPKVEATA